MTSTVRIKDNLQEYTYKLSEPTGKHFQAEFIPDLTPKQMLQLGVFGGNYFDGYIDEFPESWFIAAKLSDVHTADLNYFGVDASQSRAEWQRKGWIHSQDPRGWFQWYCRYYLGRRSDDDTRQIKRWKAIRRHIGQLKAHCHPGDELCRPVQRQAVLHWSYDSRKI